MVAARVSSAEEARRGAETTANEMESSLTLTQADLAALRVEAEALRSRCSDLEADLSAVAEEMAAATIARAEAARLRRERDESRDRARSERDLAAADRLRAAEAELRATELEGQLRSAERRIVQLTTATRQERSTRAPEVEEPPVPAPPPWIELQRANAEPVIASRSPEAEAQPSFQASQASLETMAEAPDPQRGKHEQTRIIDLTEGDEAKPDQVERIGQAVPWTKTQPGRGRPTRDNCEA